MRKFLEKAFGSRKHEEEDDMELSDDEYIELNTEGGHHSKQDVIVRTFSMEDFSDVKLVLDVLRDGNTICLINIRPLREKEMTELKRAISKLKKTCEATNGDIAGFGEDYIVVTPSFAKIWKQGMTSSDDLDDD